MIQYAVYLLPSRFQGQDTLLKQRGFVDYGEGDLEVAFLVGL